MPKIMYKETVKTCIACNTRKIWGEGLWCFECYMRATDKKAIESFPSRRKTTVTKKNKKKKKKGKAA